MAVKTLRGIGVYLNVRGIANTNMSKLRLEEVGLYRSAVLDEIDNLNTCSDQLTWMDLQSADSAVGGCSDLCVSETDLCDRHACGLGGHLRL